MKAYIRNILQIVFIFYMFPSCSPTGQPVRMEWTYSKYQSWASDYLKENILYCRRIDDSVSFRTTPRLGSSPWGESWQQSFTLGKEGEFITSPDHHLKVTFRIAAMDSAGLLIKYEYRFDHRSFGKALISVDTAEIRFLYK